MGKVLYFEGAGWVDCNNVGNCRIRTAFTNDEGKKVYVEFSNGIRYIENKVAFNYISCLSCFYITDDPSVDDENKNWMKCEKKKTFEIEYTKENILKFVNEECNCSFDEIIVLDYLAGYRVFSDSKKHDCFESYNFGDEFNYNAGITNKRIEKVKQMREYFKNVFNQKYDNTSYYISNNKLICSINVPENQRIKAGYNERVFELVV